MSVAVVPIFLKSANVVLTCGADTCSPEGQLKTASIAPDAPDVLRYQTLATDGELVNVGPIVWSCSLAGVQSYNDASALSAFLLAHAGQQGTVLIQAHGDTVDPSTDAPAMELDVIVAPSTYGGDAGTWAEFDVSLPGIGQPRLVTAVVP